MSEKIELRAERNYLTVNQKTLLTSGSVNVYPVKITFSADWDGLDKRVVFWAVGDGTKITVEPDADGVCTIPWEVLTEPGQLLYAGVYGTSGEAVVLPTVWAVLGQIVRGSAPDEGSGPPTPDAWQTLKDELKQASEELADIKGYTTAAGESAAQAGSAANAAGGYAQSAAGAATEAGRQATAAGTSAGAAEQSRKDADAARAAAETARAEAKEHRDAAKKSEEEALKNANKAVEYSGKPPIIKDKTWWTWDADAKEYVDTGSPAKGDLNYPVFDVDPKTGSLYMYAQEDFKGPEFRLKDGNLEVIRNV